MNLTNFRFETDADGIALVTWDMPGRSMNVINAEVIAEIGADRRQDRQRRGDQGRGRHLRQGGLLRRRRSDMLETAGDEYARRAKAEGEEAAMRAFVDRMKQLSLRLPAPRDLRQTGRRGDQRGLHGRRLRARARLPLSGRRRHRQGARRPARDQGRPLPRRRRHAARARG